MYINIMKYRAIHTRATCCNNSIKKNTNFT